jgi:hypothetical protein
MHMVKLFHGGTMWSFPARGYAVTPGALLQIQAKDQQTDAWRVVASTTATTTASQFKQQLYAWSTTVFVPLEPYINRAAAEAQVRVLECDQGGGSCTPVNMYDRAGIDCLGARGSAGQSDPKTLDVYDIGQSCSNGRTEVNLHYEGIAGGSSQ